MSSITYREYNPLDEIQHIDLMWNSSPHVRNIQYWNWVNNKSWGGEPIIQYALDRDRIIGSYVIHPVNLFFGKNRIKAGFATQLIVHKEYRSLGILKNLNDSLIESCFSSDIEFIYGFPNNSIWDINLKLFQWIDIGKIKYYECNIYDFIVENPKYNIYIVDEQSIDKLNSAISEHSININNRTVNFNRESNWFKWRYFDNPINNYKIFFTNSVDTGLGVLVVKYYFHESTLIGHIVEIIMSDNNFDTINSLVSKMIADFKFIGINNVSFWRTNNDWIKENLLNMGFREKDKFSNFGLRNISYNDINRVSFSESWNVSMCDSDAF